MNMYVVQISSCDYELHEDRTDAMIVIANDYADVLKKIDKYEFNLTNMVTSISITLTKEDMEEIEPISIPSDSAARVIELNNY